METALKRYYQLKQKQKEIEQELTELRRVVIDYCQEHDISDLEAGGYRAKIVLQERREYDDNKLYEAFSDLELWRLLSKPDPSKIAGLVTLNVISEEKIKDTYSSKSVSLLHVKKK
ncbi:hypothetical protein [Paenibacillus faecalis]|uniref:hypothetical protein n=1 Tax=Paenibacillus faecalis TaxID=2079532 RepID=UPI000D0EA079|nr:hypothetical protein [Paenibacillus faecalis]